MPTVGTVGMKNGRMPFRRFRRQGLTHWRAIRPVRKPIDNGSAAWWTGVHPRLFLWAFFIGVSRPLPRVSTSKSSPLRGEHAGRQMRGGCSPERRYAAKVGVFELFAILSHSLRPPPHPSPLPGGEREFAPVRVLRSNLGSPETKKAGGSATGLLCHPLEPQRPRGFGRTYSTRLWSSIT